MAIVDYADKPNIKGTINKLQTYHTDAYMIAVRNGFKGTEKEWLDSLTDAAVNEATEKFNEIAASVKDETERAKISISNDTRAASEAADKSKAVWGEFQKGVGGAVGAWLDDHPEATTTVQDGSITKGKIKVGELGYVTSSMLGMTPEDKDGKNIALLTSAINGGYAVYLDGSYTVKFDTKTKINKSVDIRSLNGKHTLTFNKLGTNSYVFELTYGSADISIQNVNMQNEGTTLVLFTAADILRSGHISVFGCNVSGKIRLIAYEGADITPTAEDAVKLFSIEKCNFNNIETNFISCLNCAFDLVSIKDNTVHNFKSTFAYFGNTNEYTNGATIKEAQKNIVCTNNTVVNDLDWFDDQESYHCFLLAESKRLYYSGNVVEGLKSRVKDAPIYDVYAACDEVTYSHNVWKNNISFDAPLNCNSLAKIKGSKFARVVGNKFILEEEYVSAVGADINNLVVNIYDATLTSNIIFQDNLIDAACLCGIDYGNFAEKSVFTNNIINVGQWNGYPFLASYGREIIFSNNTVNIGDVLWDGENTVCFVYGNDEPCDHFVFDNNSIIIDKTTTPLYLIYKVNAKSGSMKFNNITAKNATKENQLFFLGSFDNFRIDNTTVSDIAFSDKKTLGFISSDYACEQIITSDRATSILEEHDFANVIASMELFGKTKIKYKWDFVIETLTKTLTDSYVIAIAKNAETGLYEVSFVQNNEADRTIALYDPARTETTWYTLKGSGGGVTMKIAAKAIGSNSVIIFEGNGNITENIMKVTKKISTVAC